MTNRKAKKLLKNIITELNQNGLNADTLVDALKELRPFAVNENRPVVSKSIRLIYQHLETFDTFAIPIPGDEEIIDEEITGEEVVGEEPDVTLASKISQESTPTESLRYILSLIENEEHKRNKQEIREFNDALKEYAETYG